MRVTHLSLSNYRNYGRLELNLPQGAVLFHGDNAQGKTNLLEALYYLATTRSPHASQDSQIINWSATEQADPVTVARIVAEIMTSQGSRQIEMRFIQERKNRGQMSFRREVLINNRKVRLMDILGQLQVVMFLPEDVNLITGSPNARRRYVNIILCQIDPVYCRTLSQYNKTLDQRNATLRQFVDGNGDPGVLAVFSEKLVDLGSKIFLRRAKFFSEIGRETQRFHYEKLTGGKETLRIGYLPRLQASQNGNDQKMVESTALWLEENLSNPEMVTARFSKAIASSLELDKIRGVTGVGPHRDDWGYWIDGRNLSDFGSRGQQRSAILATKIAEIDWMKKKTGETPILLLDEVLAELDQSRRDLLLDLVQDSEQAFLTATDPGMFSPAFLENAVSMTVSKGQITQD